MEPAATCELNRSHANENRTSTHGKKYDGTHRAHQSSRQPERSEGVVTPALSDRSYAFIAFEARLALVPPAPWHDSAGDHSRA
jgi:hypothetical protein